MLECLARACVLSRVSDSLRPPHPQWTVARQAPLSVEFTRWKYWSGVDMPSSRGSSRPRDRTRVSRIAGGFFTDWATREAPWISRILGYRVFRPGSEEWALHVWVFACFFFFFKPNSGRTSVKSWGQAVLIIGDVLGKTNYTVKS